MEFQQVIHVQALPDEPHDMDRVRRTLLVCEKKRKKEKTKGENLEEQPRVEYLAGSM